MSHMSMADELLECSLLAKYDKGSEERSKMRYTTTQQNNFQCFNNSSNLELLDAMIEKWGPIGVSCVKFSLFLEPRFEDADGKGVSSKESKVGVLLHEDLRQHLKAI